MPFTPWGPSATIDKPGIFYASDYGAQPGTDSTAALAAWVNAVNTAGGGLMVLNAGQYFTDSPLPAITAPAVTLEGAGWAQTADTDGSVISASASYTGGAILTLAAEGIEVGAGITIDGAGVASQLVVITAGNCRLVSMQARGVAASTSLTTPSFPATGTPVTNSTGSNAYVTITGGTVTNVVVNAVSVATFSPCLVYLPAGGSITVTYTGSPSWSWATPGVCIDAQKGASSLWISRACRINGVNVPSTGVQVNDTDLIMESCKPVNLSYCVMLLSGASGAQIMNNHMTPGSTGQNCVWVNGNPSHVMIRNNRFDNYASAAVQLSAPASTPNDLSIDGNDFYSTVLTSGFSPIQVDTTLNSWRMLSIRGNIQYAGGTPPAYWIGTLTQGGSNATNTTHLANLGCNVVGNTMYATTAMVGPAGAPSQAIGNMITLNGTTPGQATDTYTFPAATSATADLNLKQSTTAVTPNATAGSFGTPQTLSPDATFVGIATLQVEYMASSVGSETVNVQTTVTWNDNSTTVVTGPNITGNGSTTLSAINLIAMLGGGDGKYAKSIAFAAKSTINSSTASIVPTVLGLNQN